MEKFKQILEEAQRLNEGDLLSNVKLVPTPDDVVRGVGKILAKPFQKSGNQQQRQTQQPMTPQQPQTTRVDKKNRGTTLYFKMTDNSLPNPLFIRYNKVNNDVQFIDEVDFKRMS
jgi:hypothetical protein